MRPLFPALAACLALLATPAAAEEAKLKKIFECQGLAGILLVRESDSKYAVAADSAKAAEVAVAKYQTTCADVKSGSNGSVQNKEAVARFSREGSEASQAGTKARADIEAAKTVMSQAMLSLSKLGETSCVGGLKIELRALAASAKRLDQSTQEMKDCRPKGGR
jgi:hypothetical protein